MHTPSLAQPISGQDDVEEILVTGSLIRRSEGFTAASPLTQLSAEDLEGEGTINISQVVQNLTFNYGTGLTAGIQGTGDWTASFNLRGLGPAATLTLVDSKRVATDNVQIMVPMIALERMDIVTDGAATMYGTDAVAGVVNMIPYKEYDGFRMDYFYEQDTGKGDYDDQEISLLWGGTISDDIDVVIAGSFRDQGELRWRDRPKHYNAGLTINGGSFPGNHVVPRRDANGQLTGESRVRPDPSCGLDDVNPAIRDPAFGVLFANTCFTTIPWNFRNNANQTSLYSNFSWQASDDLTLSAQFNYARWLTVGRTFPAFPGGRVEELPVVRGELPGNPFRAVSADGVELYAQPRRGTDGAIVMDALGRPLPLRNANGQVVLAQNQFSSMAMDPLGGVPFYEDVMIDAWIAFGNKGANTQPSNFNSDGSSPFKLDERSYRAAFTADFTVPYLPEWEGMAVYSYALRNDRDSHPHNFSLSALQHGLNCDVINDREACFNPFGATDSRFLNTQAVADSIYSNNRADDEDILQTADIILTGPVAPGGFELPGGEIGVAVGYQRRDEQLIRVPPAEEISGDVFAGNQIAPFSHSRHIDSVFAEFLFPVLSNVNVSAAFRNEEFSSGQDEFIQKYGVVYEPSNWLALRATWGEAFIVPTLDQLNSPEVCGLSNVDDPFTSFQGFVTSCRTGNPNLMPETSDSIAIGFDMNPIDNLNISLTWSETDFLDRIVSTTTQDIVRQDFAAFQTATGFTPASAVDFPPLDLLRQWVEDPRSDKRIVRAPGNLETISKLFQSDTNASSMLVQAIGLQVGYSFEFRNWGTFRLNLQSTFVDAYDFQLSDIDPERSAIGRQNNDFGAVPPIPEWRGNLDLGWTRGQHNVNATVRYTDSVIFDANEFAFQQFLPFSIFRSTTEIHAWTQMDLYYTYRGLRVPGLDGDISFTLGSRNVFDREAQKVGMTSGVVNDMQDPIGRVIYGRFNYQF
ncbi:MAG: TonB-dependent receptor [Pseudomonadales bacterium]|nr:TonB-dependent receptor [Pseudomonadales bacterium]MCP5348336.1 TonB-dependent receptor [Pseudomonadales bacterium]